MAEAGGDQSYVAVGRIEVNPGVDVVSTTGTTTSNSGTFNVFTMDLTAGMSGSNLNAHSAEYLASGFKSQGTNLFRAGKSISIVIPQIEGSRNVFDAVLVSLENKANEQTMHSSSSGITVSSNPHNAANAGSSYAITKIFKSP